MPSYGPLSSEAYGIWFPEQKYEDTDFFESWIRKGNGPALELGCGDGRLLIPFVEKGLRVDGVDLSPYMLDQCRKNAAKKQLSVNLYAQAMQNLDLPGRYATLYIPYGTFMLISSMDDVRQALTRFWKHLTPGGRLIIPSLIPTESDIHQKAPTHDEWRLRRQGTRSDGSTICCYEKAHFDIANQIEKAAYLYTVTKEGKVIATEEEDLLMRWHTQEQLTALLVQAGFKEIHCVREYTNELASPNDPEFTFIATR